MRESVWYGIGLLRIIEVEEDSEDTPDDAKEDTEEGNAKLENEVKDPEAEAEEDECKHGE